MTLIKIKLDRPTQTGFQPARGSVLISPNRRVKAPNSIWLPDPFRVRLGDPFTGQTTEAGVAWAELDPSTADWVWKFDERVQGGTIKYKRVPDSPTVVEYDDLVEVDPATLAETGLPSQWVAEAADLQDQIDNISVGGVTDAAVAALIIGPGDTRDAVETVVDEKTTLTPSPVLVFENALI